MSDLHNAESYTEGLDIAVIGMGLRFPGATTIEAFWRNLREGVESIKFFSDAELRAANIPDDVLRDPTYVKAASVVDEYDRFDAAFFGFTPRDAELTDPQQRLFLECCWQALESAGYDPDQFEGQIGVYAGSGLNWYLLEYLVHLLTPAQYHQFIIGNDKDFLATRVAYKLNLRGPGVTVQTACSTSLVAVHMACQDLLNYRCDMALAGGVTISIQKHGYYAPEDSVYSPDGHCRAFDAQAKGTVFGSGVGVVVLKRLADALADGDQIDAVIKGTAINNDGASKIGYTAPSVDGQARVIVAAQTIAGVDPETINYIEAHGTGTPMGDPIEIAALTRAFRAATTAKQFCAIGSVKTNFGHLDAAAGIASLIKTVLALKHGEIPPSLNFTRPNPEIDFARSPFYVNTALRPWLRNGHPRRAGVSSFGMGGTNAHAILEEAPERPTSGPARPWQLLTLSARTPSALEQATHNLLTYLQQHPDCNLADLAYTLHVGRKSFDQRRFLVCRDVAEAVQILSSGDTKCVFTATQTRGQRDVVFMFPGQGPQYINMARELYQSEPTVRNCIDRCAQVLEAYLGLDLRDLLFPHPEAEEEAARQLLSFIQPAVFTVAYALAQLWMEWGVQPRAMIGHSLGEYVAACLAGVFSLEDALRLVAIRNQLFEQLPPGAVLAVPMAAEEVQPLLNDELALALINSPKLCAVAGAVDAVEEFQAKLSAQGIEGRRLNVTRAMHSPATEAILDTFTRHVCSIRLYPPAIPFISNVSGTWITEAEATDPHYWAKHIRQTVRFGPGLEVLLQEFDAVFLEVGPGQSLSALAKQHPAATNRHTFLASLRSSRQEQADLQFLLTTVGQFWLAGVPVAAAQLYASQRRLRLRLPTYPFERKRFWVEMPAMAQPEAPPAVARHEAPVAPPMAQTLMAAPAPTQAAVIDVYAHDTGYAEEHDEQMSMLEQLIMQQIQLMSQQLEVLQSDTSGGNGYW